MEPTFRATYHNRAKNYLHKGTVTGQARQSKLTGQWVVTFRTQHGTEFTALASDVYKYGEPLATGEEAWS